MPVPFERCRGVASGMWDMTWKLCISEAQLSLVLHHLLDFSPATLNSAEAKPVYREGRYTGSSGVLVSCFFVRCEQICSLTFKDTQL